MVEDNAFQAVSYWASYCCYSCVFAVRINSCLRIKGKSDLQNGGLKTLVFERETSKEKKADSSRRFCKELPVSIHKNTNTQNLLATYSASLASLDNRNQFCTAQATVPFALLQGL